MWLKRHRRYSVTSNRRRRNKLSVTLCNLGVGATFGESILHDLPRDSTVVTKTTCELLRVEQQDFRLIFEVSGWLPAVRAVRAYTLYYQLQCCSCTIISPAGRPSCGMLGIMVKQWN
uniref:Cyclic nucleotide-binding domain-containing protein n=1 Tax=Anopheles culicifacies TaxID=139723 RepID=A0A182LX88_9DIPT